MILAALTYDDFYYFFTAIIMVFLALLLFFIFGWWINRREVGYSPYTEHPLRRAIGIPYMTRERVYRYLFEHQDGDNRMFDLDQAAICRETGRMFPNAWTWYGSSTVDWNFIQKRYPGHFVSWGSLTDVQKFSIIDKHDSLEGFQTEFSSPTPSPRNVEDAYIRMKPGPLYVDMDTTVLMGWKGIPETDLEVLVVQKPIEKYLPGIHKKY